MTNPQTIQHLASELGMLPDSNPTYMRLADSIDQLAWDPAGSADAVAGSDKAEAQAVITDMQTALSGGKQSGEAGDAEDGDGAGASSDAGGGDHGTDGDDFGNEGDPGSGQIAGLSGDSGSQPDASNTTSRSASDAFRWAVSYIFERVAEQQSSP
jgi:hypothetical protein